MRKILIVGWLNAVAFLMGQGMAGADTTASVQLKQLWAQSSKVYQSQLPVATHWSAFSVQTGNQWFWNPAYQNFSARCLQEKQACVSLLDDRLIALQRQISKADLKNISVETATSYSLLADACHLRMGLPDLGNTFGVCGGIRGWYEQVASIWLILGYENNFAHYYAQFLADREQRIAWEQSTGSSFQAYAGHTLNNRVQALYMETQDQLDAARVSWLMLLVQATQNESPDLQLYTLSQLTRLSWRLHDKAVAEQWQSILSQMSTQHPQMSGSCAMQLNGWRTHLAKAAYLQMPLSELATLKTLNEGGCAFTQGLEEWGQIALSRTLSEEETRQLKSGLALGIQWCKKGNCPANRVQRFQQFATWLPSGLKQESRQRLKALEDDLKFALSWMPLVQSYGVDQTSYELALANASKTEFPEQSLALFNGILARIDLRQQVNNSSELLDRLEFVRYDALGREAVKRSVQLGKSVAFSRLESLRSRALLARLRLKRWQALLANESNPQAQAERNQKLAELDKATQGLKGSNEFENALAQAAEKMMRSARALIEINYLGALASQKAMREDDSFRQMASLKTPQALNLDALNSLAMREQFNAVFEGPVLPENSVYLSWLQVPGGFVANISWPDRTMKVYSELNDLRRTISVYIPFNEQDQAMLAKYRRLLGNTDARSHGAIRKVEMNAIARRLYKILLGPLEHGLNSVLRQTSNAHPFPLLVISPDGMLNLLPFETLKGPKGLLIDRFDIGYVQSLAIYKELTRRGKTPDKVQLLSVANPDYAGSKAWVELPGTLLESNAISKIGEHDGMAVTQWLGAQARRSRLLKANHDKSLSQFNLLHFATHGYIGDSESALVLAANEPQYLTDADIAGLSLNARYVLLSACDTGRGRSVSGEGVLGLPYSFVLAGASNTLMSLWSVSDAGTARLMPQFVSDLLQGQSSFSALSAVKRDFASGSQGVALADPLVWAAFVQYGINQDFKTSGKSSPSGTNFNATPLLQ